MDIDSKLSHLMDISGMPMEVARDVLENFNFDLQKAIDFFLQDQIEIPQEQPVVSTPKISPPIKPSQKTRQSPQKEKLVTAGNNDKFVAARKLAQEKRRWMLIYLSEKCHLMPTFNSDVVRDYMTLRFEKLALDKEDADGQWFYHNYSVKSVPLFAAIDPETGESKRLYYGEMSPVDLYKWLEQFLKDFPEKGGPIFLADPIVEQSSSSESESESEEIEEEQEDPGATLVLMVQFSDGRRTKMEIGENETVKKLYKKVADLRERKPDSFTLALPFGDMNDQTKKMKELNCNRALVRVVDL